MSFLTTGHRACMRSAPRRPSLLRSFLRLQRLGLITAREMAACSLDLRGFGVSPRARSLYAMEWARSLNRGCGVRVYRSGSLPPDGALLVANHRSYIDIIAILQNSPCLFLVKSEVTRWPVIGPAVRLSRCVPVDRKSPKSRTASLRSMASAIRSGASLCVFPEGTTSAGPGILPFAPGSFRLAAENGFPVVPVAIVYEDPASAWVGDESFIPHFARTFAARTLPVSVHYGPVMMDSHPESLGRRVRDWIGRQVG